MKIFELTMLVPAAMLGAFLFATISATLFAWLMANVSNGLARIDDDFLSE
jgi:hypothetical protein